MSVVPVMILNTLADGAVASAAMSRAGPSSTTLAQTSTLPVLMSVITTAPSGTCPARRRLVAARWYLVETVSSALRSPCAGAVATPPRSSILVRSRSVSGGGATCRVTIAAPACALPFASKSAIWASWLRRYGKLTATSPTAAPMAIHWRIADGVPCGAGAGQVDGGRSVPSDPAALIRSQLPSFRRSRRGERSARAARAPRSARRLRLWSDCRARRPR